VPWAVAGRTCADRLRLPDWYKNLELYLTSEYSNEKSAAETEIKKPIGKKCLSTKSKKTFFLGPKNTKNNAVTENN
jgi:hypothetical protein